MTKPSKESMDTAVKLISTLRPGPVTLETAELIATVLEEGKRHLDAEKARSEKLVKALEFYAAGHPHHSVLFHNVDYERIPKVRTVCVISEIAKGKTGEQVYNEGMEPLFELRSGLKARQTLAVYRAGDKG